MMGFLFMFAVDRIRIIYWHRTDFILESYWTLDVSQTASYEITVVRLPIHPSVNFLKIGSLVFPDVVHDNS